MGMPPYLKFSIYLLLTFIAVQAFNGRAAGSIGVPKTDHVIAKHKTSFACGQHYQQAGGYFSAKGKMRAPAHHHNKARKKISPVKIIAYDPTATAAPVINYIAIVHQTALKHYRFLYFRQINPPPPKA